MQYAVRVKKTGIPRWQATIAKRLPTAYCLLFTSPTASRPEHRAAALPGRVYASVLFVASVALGRRGSRLDHRVRQLADLFLQLALGLDQKLDLVVEGPVFVVVEPEEELADRGLDQLALGVGCVAAGGQYELELGRAVDQVGRVVQLEPRRVADLDRRRVRRASRPCRAAPSGRIRRGSARPSPGSWRSTTAAYARCGRRAAC